MGNVTIFLIVASICIGMGVLCGMLARERGRRFWAWFMPGCILWPFAHVAVIVLGSSADRRNGSAGADRATFGTKRCPDCAETILAEANVCRYCGYRFDVPQPLGHLGPDE